MRASMSFRGGACDRFARGARERSPGDDREIAVAFDTRPMVAEVEVFELVAPLVELGQVVAAPLVGVPRSEWVRPSAVY